MLQITNLSGVEKLISTLGRHLVVEYNGCDPDVLDDLDQVTELMESAARNASASIVQTVSHRFTPQGVSVVVVVEESHLSIHTWPELGYAAVDFYTCGEADPLMAHDVLVKGLRSSNAEILKLNRGLRNVPSAIQVESKYLEHHNENVDEESTEPQMRCRA